VSCNSIRRFLVDLLLRVNEDPAFAMM